MHSFFYVFTFFISFLSLTSTAFGAAIARAVASPSILSQASSSSSAAPSTLSSSFAPSSTVPAASSSASPSQKPIFHAKARVLSQSPGVRALFDITGYADGRGTYIKVEVFEGLLSDEAKGNGPYSYHVHANPVAADGNCTATMGHLNPMAVGEDFVCDPNSPQNCQEGDLSGKHGKMNGTADGSVNAFGYTDEYLRFFPQEVSLLGRSIVIHDRNKTRIACGNITSTLDGTLDGLTNEPTNRASTYVTNYSAGATKTNSTNAPTMSAQPALSLKQALFVNVTMVPSIVIVNNTQTNVNVPTMVKINGTIPFNGATFS